MIMAVKVVMFIDRRMMVRSAMMEKIHKDMVKIIIGVNMMVDIIRLVMVMRRGEGKIMEVRVFR